MKRDGDDRDDRLDDRVPEQRRPDSLAPLADEQRSNRHSAEENHEHDDLRVRAVPDEQADVSRPDGFVDQSGGTGQNEQQGKGDHATSLDTTRGWRTGASGTSVVSKYPLASQDLRH